MEILLQYKKLSIFILALLTFGFAGGVAPHTLKSTDDYMRMTRVKELLTAPEDYAPFTLERLGIPGAPVAYHWAPLLDHVLAVLVKPLTLVFTIDDAIYVTGTLLPLIHLIGLFFALYWAISQYASLNSRTSFYSFFLTLPFLHPTLRQFTAGIIDHHSWQILAIIGAYGCLLGFRSNPYRWPLPIIAGILVGLSLIFSIETLPWLFGLNVLFGLLWLERPAHFKQPALYFGISVLLTSSIFGPWNIPWHSEYSQACDAYSLPYFSLAGVMGLFWVLIGLLPARFTTRPILNLILSAGVGFVLAVSWALFFPACLQLSYSDAPQALHTLWLNMVSEAQPLIIKIRIETFSVCLTMIVVISAFLAALARSFSGPDKALWAGHCVILALAIGLSFWQYRIMDFGILFAVLPWIFLVIPKVLHFLGAYCPRDIRLVLLPMFFITAAYIYFHNKDMRQTMASPSEKCAIADLAAYLNSDTHPAAPVVVAWIDNGPEILFRTHAHVVAAPYHRNIQGIIQSQEALLSPDEAQARMKLRSLKADYVYLCTLDYKNLDYLSGEKPYFFGHLKEQNLPHWLRLEQTFKNARLYRIAP